MGKDSPQQPAPPDYKGAAEAQARSTRVNQITPYGSLMYSNSFPDGVNEQVTATTNLAPQAQKTLDTQMQLSGELGDVALGQLGNVRDTYSQPIDLSSVQQIADKAYGSMTSRLDPQWAQREEQTRARLANQGLVEGHQAYDTSMDEFNRARNDAYQQANLGAISTMPQTYQLATSTYNQPLNVLNALRTGAQINNPQFQGPGQATNYLGAAQAQGGYDQGLYNAQVGSDNAMMSGLFGLGSAGIMGAGAAGGFPKMFSDRRLKSNIVRVGTHPLGIGIYEYDIFGSRQVGVMADEVEKVLPEAVTEIGGFKAVNYGML